jgi:kynureninase
LRSPPVSPCGGPVATPTEPPVTERAHAELLDADDPLGHLVDELVVDDRDLLYLDGNSLGRLPRRTQQRLRAVVDGEWGRGLVRSWEQWIELPIRVGDALGLELLGARPGEVVVGDSTTVNLYKAAMAALDARADRRTIVTDDDNFPTDRYVLEGLAAQRGLELRVVTSDPIDGPSHAAIGDALDVSVALLSLSHVAYRSGALADIAALTTAAHDVGAMTVWDLSHSVGAVPIDLTGGGVDLAVGCTYKYVNGGPGAPAFTYVRRELQPELRQPIWGWFGQRDQFGMAASYDPAAGIDSWLTGTPSVLALAAVEEGVGLLAEAGIDRLRAKGTALTALLIELADAWLAPLGFEVATPRDPSRRGSHVALAHADAERISRALIDRAVVPDFRAPDLLRLGPAPVSTRFVDVWDAMDRLRRSVEAREHERQPAPTRRVT